MKSCAKPIANEGSPETETTAIRTGPFPSWWQQFGGANLYSLRSGKKYRPRRKPKVVRYTHPDAKPLRVTLWLVPSVIEEIREMASKTLRGTRGKRPRTGVVCTELICYALEQLHEDLK